MKDSVTYQAILDEGKILALQELLLEQGEENFGDPSNETKMTVRGITDLDRLKKLCRRLLHVTTWQELFAES
jgi:hypothetical protein